MHDSNVLSIYASMYICTSMHKIILSGLQLFSYSSSFMHILCVSNSVYRFLHIIHMYFKPGKFTKKTKGQRLTTVHMSCVLFYVCMYVCMHVTLANDRLKNTYRIARNIDVEFNLTFWQSSYQLSINMNFTIL